MPEGSPEEGPTVSRGPSRVHAFDVDGFLVQLLPRLPSATGFIGADPRRAESLPTAPCPAQLHEVCRLTLPPNGFSSQPWWNDKAVRKEKWSAWGMPDHQLVPTLYHTYVTTERVWDEAACDFAEDEHGTLSLEWPESHIRHVPHDANCAEALRALLRSRGQLVLKPIEGNRAEGVMLVTVTDAADGCSQDLELTVRGHTSEVRLINKCQQQLTFADWFQSCILHNAALKVGLLVEPLIEWDNEVTCLSVGGGSLIVLGSKGGGLVRSSFAAAATRGVHMPVDPIVVAAGNAPLIVLPNTVTDLRRESYQLKQPAKHEDIRTASSPSEMLVECSDISGRKLWQVSCRLHVSVANCRAQHSMCHHLCANISRLPTVNPHAHIQYGSCACYIGYCPYTMQQLRAIPMIRVVAGDL